MFAHSRNDQCTGGIIGCLASYRHRVVPCGDTFLANFEFTYGSPFLTRERGSRYRARACSEAGT